MELTPRDVEQFERDGFLRIPSVFSTREVRALKREALGLSAPAMENTLEPDGTTVRSALGLDRRSALFARLGRHPRLVFAAQRLLGGEVYLHQLKVNYKAARDGGAWHWHQDFDTWHRQDGMPKPLALSAAVFLDEVTAANGPLMFIPGSHKKRLRAEQRPGERSYPQFTLPAATVTRLVKRHGIAEPAGPAGTVLLFHANMVHASASNLSAQGRMIAFVCLNLPRNRIRQYKRPEWVSSRDFSPVVPLADNCLRTRS